jgi:hypothetical protein
VSDQAKRELPEHMRETLSSDGKIRQVELWYPSVEGNPTHVEVNLMCVRATDGIRISYDYDRNGWKVEQDSNVGEAAGDGDPDWQEVAFVASWGRERPPVSP